MNDCSRQHKAAWEFDAYGFWLKHAGTPQERAKKSVADPAAQLGRYAAYFERFG